MKFANTEYTTPNLNTQAQMRRINPLLTYLQEDLPAPPLGVNESSRHGIGARKIHSKIVTIS